MYERVGKTMAASLLLLGLAIGLIGISNNPDELPEVGMADGIGKPGGAKTIETMSSHGSSEPPVQKLPKTQRGMERTQGEA